VYSKFQIAFKYFQYLLKSSNGKGHGIHSPFVYDLVRNVLNDKKDYEVYNEVESLRSQLLQNKTILTIEDFGAGSRINLQKQRAVAAIAKSSLKPKKFSQLLFRIAKYYQLKQIIELGTSLGITSSYLSLADKNATVTTLEGSPAVALVAKNNFTKLNLRNIKLVEGNFDNALPGVLNEIKKLDLGFVDGNHRKQPTLDYFHQLLTCINESSILVFDDIHWSKEMDEAWDEIKKHPAVTITVDLFFIGIVFFRKENKAKENFLIRF
jgi:predicted O-methyltransferase YrrM